MTRGVKFSAHVLLQSLQKQYIFYTLKLMSYPVFSSASQLKKLIKKVKNLGEAYSTLNYWTLGKMTKCSSKFSDFHSHRTYKYPKWLQKRIFEFFQLFLLTFSETFFKRNICKKIKEKNPGSVQFPQS